jgi:hypothetical protein
LILLIKKNNDWYNSYNSIHTTFSFLHLFFD